MFFYSRNEVAVSFANVGRLACGASTAFSGRLAVGHLLICLKYMTSAGNAVVRVISRSFKTEATSQPRPRVPSSSFDVRDCDRVAQFVKFAFRGNYDPVMCKCNGPL